MWLASLLQGREGEGGERGLAGCFLHREKKREKCQISRSASHRRVGRVLLEGGGALSRHKYMMTQRASFSVFSRHALWGGNTRRTCCSSRGRSMGREECEGIALKLCSLFFFFFPAKARYISSSSSRSDPSRSADNFAKTPSDL